MRARHTLAAAALLLAACSEGLLGTSVEQKVGPGGGSDLPGKPPEQIPIRVENLGDPIPGLSPSELAAFHRGREVFERRFKPSEGLGPLYNATSCVSCHSTPITGGSAQLYRNFYLAVVDAGFFQASLNELPSVVVPSYGQPPHAISTFSLNKGRLVIPDEVDGLAVITAQRNAIPIFGVGLFEFVRNATILENADPRDLDGDGISGRFNRDSVGIGRFGVKAQSNNIELFTRPPLQNQMGVTSDPFEGEDATVSLSMAAVQEPGDPNDPTFDDDGVPDPEISHQDLGDLIAFTRFLGPPPRKPFNDAARRGNRLFDQIGCTACHIPSLRSTRGAVEAHTDLLIHDMGPELADNISFGSPQPYPSPNSGNTRFEFRTQPLWGVSMHAPFLHDGRAETLEEAILMHGGEGLASRDGFAALTPQEQADVIEFLEHL